MRSRKALFLGFTRGVADDPPMIVFLVEHLKALAELRYNHGLRGELVVVVSPFPELTSGDFFDTFPATRERSAARIARAEYAFTDAVYAAGLRSNSRDGSGPQWYEGSEGREAGDVPVARPDGTQPSGRES